ncbi:MAG TPA: ABC transporter permease [Bacillota bacterium]|jgi:peptide/nickel transport system permease protein|nr:ABC transporter permease [Bacillota bacterium]HOB42485.1 ABC transporter permease [Bacillota bacterium]HOO30762.1 ABC transporter permease [Bacillota bacterium]HPZ13571.1 ABC transporter permease [Bacillota bacterium]HQD80034.1 ABC transporter permease [Bacillota bacterium]
MEGTRKRIADSFFKHKLGMVGLVVLIIFYLVVIFADFVAPYNFAETHRNFIYAPPSKVKWVDSSGKWVGPHIHEMVKSRDPVTYELVYAEDPDSVVPLKFFVRGEKYRFLGLWESDLHLFGVEASPEKAMFLVFGADRFGRDLFSRIVIGGRVSMTVGLLGTFLSVFIGAIVGALSGYYGGWVDVLIQRFTELLRSFPRIPLWLALAVIIPPSWPSTWVYFGIVTVLSLIGWMGVARVMRGMTLSLREKEYVLAAKVMGVSDWKIITKHLIPNTLSYLIVVSTLSIPGMILGESTISFLGLGIKEPMTSWGLLLSQAQSLSELEAHPWLMVPGIFIMIAVLSFNFVGDALRDAVDPYRTVEKV